MQTLSLSPFRNSQYAFTSVSRQLIWNEQKPESGVSMNTVNADESVELTLLMPCLNEARTLGSCITKGMKALKQLGIVGEILVADNGSDDGSPDIAQQYGARVISVKQKGYGSALISGIKAAKGHYIIMGDADDSYDWSNISAFVHRLRGGADLVMGCRLPKGGGTILPGAMPWLHRWIGNPVLSGIGRLFFDCPVADFHCGMRGFSRTAILSLGLNTAGMEFASDMVIKATLAKMRIEETPVTLFPDGRDRAPHLSTWRDGWRHLRFMMILSPRWVFFMPGIFFFLAGVFGFTLILPGAFHVGSVDFDVNTLVICSLAVVTGAQCITFWALGQTYASRVGLYPKDPLLAFLATYIHLEIGLLTGVFFTVVGLGLLFLGIHNWALVGFGSQSYETSLRVVVPAVTLIALGIQTFFTSFLMSMLGIRKFDCTRANRPTP